MQGCRAEPGAGPGTDQGLGKDLSPATGSWLALMTALPRAATVTHCSEFWGNSGSSALWGAQLPRPALFWVSLQPQHLLKPSHGTVLLQHHCASLCTVHCQCHLPQNSIFSPSLRTLHLVQSFPCHAGSGSASIGFQK